MAIRVAVNGLGRTGRMLIRAGLSEAELDFVAVNDIADRATLAHLL